MAKNVNTAVAAAKNASKAPAKEAPAKAPETTAADARKVAKATAEFLVGKLVKVNGGRKFKDQKAIVGWGGVNKFGSAIVRAAVDGEDAIQFFDAKHLEVLADADKKSAAAVIKRITDERDATLYIAATVYQERDKAIQLGYAGWFKRIWFTKEMVSDTGATLNDEAKTQIFEIPVWKVKSEVGGDAVEMLRSKQAELEALVNA